MRPFAKILNPNILHFGDSEKLFNLNGVELNDLNRTLAPEQWLKRSWRFTILGSDLLPGFDCTATANHAKNVFKASNQFILT